MNIHFGFSYIGLLFLLMLFVPNFFWIKHKPQDYEKYAKNENCRSYQDTFGAFERNTVTEHRLRNLKGRKKYEAII